MNKSELFLKLAAIPEGDPRLAAISGIITGHVVAQPARPVSLRLLRMGEAAKETSLSRTSIWRAVKEKRIRAVMVRRGSFRIPESELIRFVKGEE